MHNMLSICYVLHTVWTPMSTIFVNLPSFLSSEVDGQHEVLDRGNGGSVNHRAESGRLGWPHVTFSQETEFFHYKIQTWGMRCAVICCGVPTSELPLALTWDPSPSAGNLPKVSFREAAAPENYGSVIGVVNTSNTNLFSA